MVRQRVAEFIGDDMLLAQALHDRAIRLLDVFLSITALFFLWPAFCLIGLLILLDSRGPVFFSQSRVGQRGRIFTIYKFRTMKPASEPVLYQYRKNSRDQFEPVIKGQDDTRVTAIGRLLRKYSLDELPQFFNILKGDMSLVGARPTIPEEVKGYSAFEKRRLAGKPGLTGLAQINGRSEMDFDKIVVFDVYYHQHRSLGFYLEIVLLTFPAFLSGKSSY